MSLKDIFNKVKKEAQVLQGEEVKHKVFTEEQLYPDVHAAKNAFERAKQKLFHIDKWSELPGINSTFALYNQNGEKTEAPKPEVGFYMKIILPGTPLENWVQIAEVVEEPNLAEFTVHPSPDPQQKSENPEEVKHFFIKEASSTFRVELQDTTLKSYQIGLNEGINNQGEEAGTRAVINTLVAEGGWAGFQKLQWGKLTSYLVHQLEAEEK